MLPFLFYEVSFICIHNTIFYYICQKAIPIDIAIRIGIGIQARHAAIEIGRTPDKTQLTNQNTPFMAKSPTVNFAIYFFVVPTIRIAHFGTLVGYNPPRHTCATSVDFRLLDGFALNARTGRINYH